VLIQRQVPHAALEVVPGGGHWLHVEAPELVVRAVDRVLPACA
jgi:pimeloyl-ACP methyl ester carboxylesterase